jgi:hypothetical protein
MLRTSYCLLGHIREKRKGIQRNGLRKKALNNWEILQLGIGSSGYTLMTRVLEPKIYEIEEMNIDI